MQYSRSTPKARVLIDWNGIDLMGIRRFCSDHSLANRHSETSQMWHLLRYNPNLVTMVDSLMQAPLFGDCWCVENLNCPMVATGETHLHLWDGFQLLSDWISFFTLGMSKCLGDHSELESDHPGFAGNVVLLKNRPSKGINYVKLIHGDDQHTNLCCNNGCRSWRWTLRASARCRSAGAHDDDRSAQGNSAWRMWW